jgi:CelD/BcsL family acetyltransferase involved in cellulose biosynthesis/GNAT superfamily N-acetyltransferase
MAGVLRTRVVRGRSELAALTPAWTELHQRVSDNPFLAPEWTGAWIDVGREEPFVGTAWDGDRLVALLPLVLRVGPLGRRLEFVEGDAFGMLHDGEPNVAAEALASALEQERGSWDAMILSELLEESPATGALRDALRARGMSVRSIVTSGYPFVTIEGPLAAYDQRVGKKVVREITRRQRQLQELAPTRFERIATAEDIDRWFPRLVEQHRRRWRDRSDTSAFSDPIRTAAMREAAVRAARRGMMALDLLLLDDVLIAYCYSLLAGRRLVYYSPGFDPAYAPYSASKILLRWQVANCFERGLSEFDFSRGDEPYKRVWATGARAGSTVLIHHGPGGRPLVEAFLARSRAVVWLKSNERVVRLRRVGMGRLRERLRPSTWQRELVEASRRVHRSIQDRGVGPSFLRAAGRAAARLHRHFDGRLYRCALPVAAPETPAGVSIERLRPAQFEELAEGGRYDHAEVVRRHYAGQRCWTARVAGMLASYAWEVSGRAVAVPELGETLELAKDEIYLADCYTLAPHRGKGLYPLLLRAAMADASRRGMRSARIVVEEGNAASQRGIERAGFTLERRVDRRIWLPQGEGGPVSG